MNKLSKTCLGQHHVAVDASVLTVGRSNVRSLRICGVIIRQFRYLLVVSERRSRASRGRCGSARRTAHRSVSHATAFGTPRPAGRSFRSDLFTQQVDSS